MPPLAADLLATDANGQLVFPAPGTAGPPIDVVRRFVVGDPGASFGQSLSSAMTLTLGLQQPSSSRLTTAPHRSVGALPSDDRVERIGATRLAGAPSHFPEERGREEGSLTAGGDRPQTVPGGEAPDTIVDPPRRSA